MTARASATLVAPPASVTTLIFDIDDTLYDVATHFTAHRNGDAVFAFMCEKLGFASHAEAKVVRDEYFARYHATGKGLKMAEKDGRLPAGATFELSDLSEWWASRLDFSLLGGPDPVLIEALESCPLRLVAFSNSPRRYALRVLDELGLRRFFPDDAVFAVDDVLPSCKPEAEAFEIVLKACGVEASECVMVEDSMKNVRAAKALGMKTILVAGIGGGDVAEASKAGKTGDAPRAEDPAVDCCVERARDMRARLPGLWAGGSPAVFAPLAPLDAPLPPDFCVCVES